MIGVHQLNEYLMGGCVALRKHLASHPAALGLNPLAAEIFLSDYISLFCLVCEQY